MGPAPIAIFQNYSARSKGGRTILVSVEAARSATEKGLGTFSAHDGGGSCAQVVVDEGKAIRLSPEPDVAAG